MWRNKLPDHPFHCWATLGGQESVTFINFVRYPLSRRPESPLCATRNNPGITPRDSGITQESVTFGTTFARFLDVYTGNPTSSERVAEASELSQNDHFCCFCSISDIQACLLWCRGPLLTESNSETGVKRVRKTSSPPLEPATLSKSDDSGSIPDKSDDS